MVNNCRAGRLTVCLAHLHPRKNTGTMWHAVKVLRLTVSNPGRDMDSFAFVIHPLEVRFEEYTVCRDITLERVQEITAISGKQGFRMSGLRSFEREGIEEQIEAVRKNARNGKRQARRLT